MENNNQLQENQPTTIQPRQIAIKTWIKPLIKGKYVIKEGWDPNYILINNQKVSRANIIGIVVQKSDSKLLNYDYIVIDDGSERITIRSFEDKDLFIKYNVGDIINVIGRPREFGKEIYMMPEIVKKIDNIKWLEVRKLELGEVPNIADEQKTHQATEEIEVEEIETPQERLIKIIRKIDGGTGVDIQDIIQKTGKPRTEEIIKDMLNQGDIFEIKPGRIKILE